MAPPPGSPIRRPRARPSSDRSPRVGAADPARPTRASAQGSSLVACVGRCIEATAPSAASARMPGATIWACSTRKRRSRPARASSERVEHAVRSVADGVHREPEVVAGAPRSARRAPDPARRTARCSRIVVEGDSGPRVIRARRRRRALRRGGRTWPSHPIVVISEGSVSTRLVPARNARARAGSPALRERVRRRPSRRRSPICARS